MSEQTAVHIGIDLAWGTKNRTGLAALASDGRLLASGSARTDDEIVDWIVAHAEHIGVVAIDAPLVVVNQAGRRGCEASIHAAFGRFDASPHSTNLGKAEMRPPRGAVIAERLGLPIDPEGPRAGVAIEVYPHPAMVGLWELDLILKYKHKAKFAFDYRKQEFWRLLELLESEASLSVVDAPRWSEIREVATKAARHGDLNQIEDEVDGIVCGWLAWLWAVGDARLEIYGDVASGYIVAPPRPEHGPRPRRDRMAPKPRVRFEEVGSAAASGPIIDSPSFFLDGPNGRWKLETAEARTLEATLRGMRGVVPSARES